MADNENEADALELLETAADNLETSKEHERRATQLAEEAEEQLEEEFREELPDTVEVDAESDIEDGSSQFVLSFYHDEIIETVDDVIGDRTNFGIPFPQQITIGDDLSRESTSQRERVRNIRGIIDQLADRYDDGVPVEKVVRHARRLGIDEEKAQHEIEKLKQRGEVYEPRTDRLRTT